MPRQRLTSTQQRRRRWLLLAGCGLVSWASAQTTGTAGLAPNGPASVSPIPARIGEAANVRDFGAKGDGAADDTAAIQAAFNSFGSEYAAGNVYFPAGTYKWSRAIIVPGRVGFFGDGIATMLKPLGDGFIINDNATVGGTRIQDFYMLGMSATLHTGISLVPGPVVKKWLQGLSMSNVVIDRFGTGINAKNLRHSLFDHVTINRASKGLRFVGQCVSNTVQNCKITRDGGAFGDGSVGIEVQASNEYEDNAERRPEAIKIQSETLVYGYDTDVWVHECLNFVVKECDLDASFQYGLRVGVVSGGLVIRDNFIASLQLPGKPPKALWLDPLDKSLNIPVVIEGNHLHFVGKPVSGGTAISVGANRTGLISIKNNMLNGGNGTAIGLRLESGNATVEDNYIQGSAFSLVTTAGSIGHSFSRNTLNGTIVRPMANSGKDSFSRNRGTAVTCYHGPVTLNAGATIQAVPLSTLGLLGNPNVGEPAYLLMHATAQQYQGAVSRGNVQARYDGAGHIIVEVSKALSETASDVWVDMEAS